MTERTAMETETKIEYLIKVFTKGSIENSSCYCKSISEVADAVYYYLTDTDERNLNGILVTPLEKVYYKKDTDEGETIPPYRSAPPEWYGNEDDDDTFNDDEDDNDGMD